MTGLFARRAEDTSEEQAVAASVFHAKSMEKCADAYLGRRHKRSSEAGPGAVSPKRQATATPEEVKAAVEAAASERKAAAEERKARRARARCRADPAGRHRADPAGRHGGGPRHTAGGGVEPHALGDLGVEDDPNELAEPTDDGVGYDWAAQGHVFDHVDAMPHIDLALAHWASLPSRSTAPVKAADVRVPAAPLKARERGFTVMSPLMTAKNERQRQYVHCLVGCLVCDCALAMPLSLLPPAPFRPRAVLRGVSLWPDTAWHRGT